MAIQGTKSRLHRKVEQVLAGKRQRQVPVALRLTGRAAETWTELVNVGEHVGLKPAEVMGLLLECGGAALQDVLTSEVGKGGGR